MDRLGEGPFEASGLRALASRGLQRKSLESKPREVAAVHAFWLTKQRRFVPRRPSDLGLRANVK